MTQQLAVAIPPCPSSPLPFSLFVCLTFPDVTTPARGHLIEPVMASSLSLGAFPLFSKKGGKIGPGFLTFVLEGAWLSLNMQNACYLNLASPSWQEELGISGVSVELASQNSEKF